MPSALVWFRDDLRLNDQPALQAALAQEYAAWMIASTGAYGIKLVNPGGV